MANPNDPPRVVRIDSWGNEVPTPSAGHRVPLIGIFLILLGLLLAAGQFFNVAAVGASAFFLALGVILVAAGLRDRNDLALYAGLFVTAIAASDLMTGLGLVHGSGWGLLIFGLALVAMALIRTRSGRRPGATVVVGILLAIWGGAGVAADNLNFSIDRLVGPALIVLIGLWVVMRSGRGRA
jgi:hypothetical protein